MVNAGRRKRVTANKPPSVCTAESLNILFAELVVGSKDMFVELDSCIPFTKIRPLSSSGVRRLVSSFRGDEAKLEPSDISLYQSTGMALGSDIGMVVPLVGGLSQYVSEYFIEEGFRDEELQRKVKTRELWFGIVDGLHSHAALTFLKKNYSKWSQFKWYVKCLNSGFSIEKYRQLGRVQNARHHKHFYIELTLFDVLYNLKLEHEKLKREKRKCGGSETAHAYDGAQHARNSTLQQKANLSIRLPISVLEEMGSIMNKDHPEMILSSRSMCKRGAETVDQLMEREDCRLFRSFLTASTLKGSATFMNATGDSAVQLQVDCLHRVKDLYAENGFKSIKPDDLTSQFKFTQLADKECKKFLRFIEEEHWPKEMIDVRQNIMRTTVLNIDLEENAGNDNTILEPLLSSYRRHFPDSCTVKEAKWKASIEIDSTSVEKDVGNQDQSTESSTTMIAATDDPIAEPEPPEEPINPNALLDERNIYSYNMTWKEYLTNKRNEDSCRFDLLITRPLCAPNRSYIRSMRQNNKCLDIQADEMVQFSKFIKRVMKTGSYIVLFVHFSMMKEWYTVLDEEGILVMSDQYIIAYNVQAVKKRKISNFSQSAHDVAIIAKIPGSHPDSFSPPFEEDNDQLSSLYSRRFSIMLDAPVCKTFLTRAKTRVPFDTKEFDPEVFAHFLNIFSPSGGAVIDPFARTMTAGIASLNTSRSCHLIEKSSDCFEAAMERLRLAVTPLPSTNTVGSLTYTKPQTRIESQVKESFLDTHSAIDTSPNQSSSGEQMVSDSGFQNSENHTTSNQLVDPNLERQLHLEDDHVISRIANDQNGEQVRTETANTTSTLTTPMTTDKQIVHPSRTLRSSTCLLREHSSANSTQTSTTQKTTLSFEMMENGIKK